MACNSPDKVTSKYKASASSYDVWKFATSKNPFHREDDRNASCCGDNESLQGLREEVVDIVAGGTNEEEEDDDDILGSWDKLSSDT